MLKDGADANTKDDHGVTPLVYAAAAGSVDAMKLLLDKGADAKGVNRFGSTALMWSVTDIAKVRLLLDHGAPTSKPFQTGTNGAPVGRDERSLRRHRPPAARQGRGPGGRRQHEDDHPDRRLSGARNSNLSVNWCRPAWT